MESGWSNYTTPVELPFPFPTSVYGAMLAIWQLRPALQRRFPLHNGRPADYWRLLAWCAAHGRNEYAILREIPEWEAELNRPIRLPLLKGDRWGPTYSLGMFLVGVARQNYRLSPILGNVRWRQRAARWYWRGRRHDCLMPPPPDWQLSMLRSEYGHVEGLAEALRQKDVHPGEPPKALVGTYRLEDVADRLPRPLAAEHVPTIALDKSSVACKLVGAMPVALRRARVWWQSRKACTPSPAEIGKVTGLIERRRQNTGLVEDGRFGVNLFGYARGELGIGEDVRMMAVALESAGIPFCIINVQPGGDVSQKDTSAEHWIAERPQYAINVFCMTGIEHVRYAVEQGLRDLRGRYTIGLWPWELPQWPSSWAHAFNCVDEIWGISRYTAGAYTQAPVPVHPMSLPVTAEPVAHKERKDFGLPEKDYLFVFAFDLNSTTTRKNPEGVIDAFRRAFGQESANVGLVIKTHHVEENHPGWQRLLSLIGDDSRIHLVTGTLRRPELLSLYKCCNCFVSLHRAEGFGRGLAEAMLLGKQVIATDFSGNRDFCGSERVGLVSYRERPLGEDEYFYGEGQYWAEPDIDHAASLMREAARNQTTVMSPGHDFSPETTGRRYAQRLMTIMDELTPEEDIKRVALPATGS